MKHEFSWSSEWEEIVVSPPIPTGLAPLEQIALVIQKVEALKTAIEEGADPDSWTGWRSCAFCVNSMGDEGLILCDLCLVVSGTGMQCGGAAPLSGITGAAGAEDRVAAISATLAVLRRHEEEIADEA